MFDEKDNYFFERFNDWYEGFVDDSYGRIIKDGWMKRYEYFVCLKKEQLDHLANRYQVLLDQLKDHEIRISDAEKVSKFTDALPAEWDEFLKNLKKDYSFSKFYLKGFISNLKHTSMKIIRKREN
ncbi:hypothetical protein Hanom_Chr11g01028001 [Helianthus anomalus]